MLLNAMIPSITESLPELERLLRRQSQAERKRRLHLLVLLKSEQVSTIQAAADHLALHRNTVRTWLQRYVAGGLPALLHRQKPGPKVGAQRTLPPAALAALKRRLADPAGIASYVELQSWLARTFEIEVPYATLHKLVRYRLGAKLKRPRPRHAKKKSTP